MILPTILNSDDERRRFASGKRKLDDLLQAFLRKCEYQFAVVGTPEAARNLEEAGQRGEIFGAKPLMNP